MSNESVSAKPANPFLANFRPYIPASVHLRELTPLPLIIGTLLGMVFGASSLYLVLKVGLTVSASIPVAVISITVFRVLSKVGLKDATILENNIVQTAGSAGESIAFGVGVTMPAIMILGLDLEVTRVMLVAMLGGLLGILMMIPLRRALIVAQHGQLKYPEGTACAEVLKAGASEESRAAAHREGDVADEVRANGSEDDFRRTRRRLPLSSPDDGLQRLERHAGKSFWRAFQGRLDLGRDFSGAVGRRLHHRAAHRFDHVRGRRAGLPSSDSRDQVLRLGNDHGPGSGNCSH